MKIWAIGDLHLSFGTPNKGMHIFGAEWLNHADKIQENWIRLISQEDLVLIPGDISWAIDLDGAQKDLEWIHKLPGTKVLVKGNHDYWWGSLKKLLAVLPPSLHLIQNNSFYWKGVAIGGTRLWDCREYYFDAYMAPHEIGSNNREEAIQDELQDKIWQRELARLKASFETFPPDAKMRIAMTHYPPIGGDLAPSSASAILEKYRIDISIFGHLHGLKQAHPLFGKKNGVVYCLTSCDYLHFSPSLVSEIT